MNFDANSNESFVINLDRDGDRLAHALRQHPKLRRWPGIEVRSSRNLKDYARFFREDFDFVPPDAQLGNYGCTLSHLTLLEATQESEKDVIFVFEDDFVLSRPFADLIDAVNRFPQDWDLINLGGWHSEEPPMIEPVVYEGCEYTRVLDRVKGTFGLAVRTRSIPMILELARGNFGAGGSRGGTRFADKLFLRMAPSIRYYMLERGAFVDHEGSFLSSREVINRGNVASRALRLIKRVLRM
jgi:GR25 family glycosyltransferase involved in LPS biosynthesis